MLTSFFFYSFLWLGDSGGSDCTLTPWTTCLLPVRIILNTTVKGTGEMEQPLAILQLVPTGDNLQGCIADMEVLKVVTQETLDVRWEVEQVKHEGY